MLVGVFMLLPVPRGEGGFAHAAFGVQEGKRVLSREERSDVVQLFFAP